MIHFSMAACELPVRSAMDVIALTMRSVAAASRQLASGFAVGGCVTAGSPWYAI
jgi:hypothetical protein